METTNPRTIWKWALGSLAVTAAINLAALAYLRTVMPNPTYHTIRDKWHLFLALDHPIDWIILGDSSGNNGGVPSVFSDRLGGTCVNLSTLGASSALNQAWMLQLYLQRFPPPKGVIVINSVGVGLTGCQQSAIAQVPVSYKTLSRLKPEPFRGVREWTQAIINRYVPLYAENKTLGTLIRTPWQMADMQREYNPLRPDGFAARLVHRPDEFTPAAKAAYLKQISKDEPLSECVDGGFSALAAAAAEAQVPVYFTSTPVEDEIFNSDGFGAFYSRLRERLESYGEGKPLFHYLPLWRSFPDDQFYTRDHLLLAAATKFSEEFSDRIKGLSK